MKNTLKVQRAIHDMTQDDLAKKVGVTRQTINSIETQKYDPSLSLAFKLAILFNVRIEELFIYEKEPIKPASGESCASLS
jgi:putative transcriptional regulator